MQYPEWRYACMQCLRNFMGFLYREPTSCSHCHRADWDKGIDYFAGSMLVYDPKSDPGGVKTLEAAYISAVILKRALIANNATAAERLMSPKVRALLNGLKKEGL